MYLTLLILMAAAIFLVVLIPITSRFENQRYTVLRGALLHMKSTGSFAPGNKAGEALLELNIGTREQLDRYVAFCYRDIGQAMERQKTHILAVSVLLAMVFIAGLAVPAVFAGDASRSVWVERIYVPLSEILVGIFVFALCIMLATRSSAKRIMWIFREYLQ